MTRFLLLCCCFAGCGAEPPWAQSAPDAGSVPRGDDLPSPKIEVAGPWRQTVAPNTSGVSLGSLVISTAEQPLIVTDLGFVVTDENGFYLRPGDAALAGRFLVTDQNGTEVLRLRGSDPWLYGAPAHCQVSDGLIGAGCNFEDVNEMIHRIPYWVNVAPGEPARLDFSADIDWRVRDGKGYRLMFLAIVSQRPEDFEQFVFSLLFGFVGTALDVVDPTSFCQPLVGSLYGFGGCCGTHAELGADDRIPAYSLVQREGEPTVARLGFDSKLHPFRSSFELTSWNGLDGPNGFPDVLDHLLCNRVISLPAARYDALQSGRTAALRPGMHVVQDPSGQLYVVARGRMLRPVTAAAAAAIYPDSVGSRLVPLPAAALNDYLIGPGASGPGDYDPITEYRYASFEFETQ